MSAIDAIKIEPTNARNAEPCPPVIAVPPTTAAAIPSYVKLLSTSNEPLWLNAPSSTPTIAVPQVRAGRARALAFTGAARWPLMPEVPTLSETIAGFTIAAGWDGIFVPARVPVAAVNKIQSAIRTVIQEPKVRELLVAGGYEPVGSTPEEFRKFFLGEMNRYAEIVREAKIQPE